MSFEKVSPGPKWPSVFHPFHVLFFSLCGAALYALYARLRFPPEKLAGLYLYVVPIVAPFVAFIFDRLERWSQSNAIKRSVDALVVGLSMWRVIGHVPFISGHALFLTYALLSARSRVAQITAALVMLEVVYLKFFVWHDWLTPSSGIVLGAMAAFISQRFGAPAKVESPTQSRPK